MTTGTWFIGKPGSYPYRNRPRYKPIDLTKNDAICPRNPYLHS